MIPNPLALISGASSGIGKATAKNLYLLGYDLILMARRTERLNDLKQELETLKESSSVSSASSASSVSSLSARTKPKVFLFTGDVSSIEDIQKMIQTHNDILKHLSVIVNNAGLAKGSDPLHKNSIQELDQVINTNIKGLLYMTHQLIPYLIEQKNGHIVNIGSVAGRWVYPGGTVYCASKFAVSAITEGLRQDLNGTGIRVTNIEPGMVESEFSIVRYNDDVEKAKNVYEGMTPLTPEDVAECITWSLTRPKHVNIQEMVIFPTDQGAIRMVHRTPIS